MKFFETNQQQKAKGESWYPFSVNCMGGQSLARYTFWTRLKIAILIIFNKDISELHIPFEGSTAEDVGEWVKNNRNPAICKALETAVEAFSHDDEDTK